MIRKIALCALLVLVIVPALALAAGPQGQGAGTGIQLRDCLQARQQDTGEEARNEQVRTCLMQGNRTGVGQDIRQMVQNRISGQDGLQVRNMTGISQKVREHAGLMNQSRLQDGSCGACLRSRAS